MNQNRLVKSVSISSPTEDTAEGIKRMKTVPAGGLLHVRRVNRADVAGIQEFVIHRDEDP